MIEAFEKSIIAREVVGSPLLEVFKQDLGKNF